MKVNRKTIGRRARGTGSEQRCASRSLVFLTWRDSTHPEGGGSELFVERVAAQLVLAGWSVTICCAAHAGAPADEMRDGVRFRRRGGRLTVYAHGFAYLLARGDNVDIVVDVQNGVPFFASLARHRGLVVLVHHVHREQWQIIYPGPVGRFGWWLESRLVPRLYRRLPYVTVSEASRAGLVGLGIDSKRITVVHNGIDAPHPDRVSARARTPTICILGRLVPHKQVEHALHALAALRADLPDVHLEIVGDGWWRAELTNLVEQLDLGAFATFRGYVSTEVRDQILDQSWLLLVPSVKEGWGIAIMEAAARGVPAIAYRSAGGVAEAIVDGETGWLVEGREEFEKRVGEMLRDTDLRERLGENARRRAAQFTWTSTAAAFGRVLDQVFDDADTAHRRPTTGR